jgi:hypothetical protein
MAADDTQVEGAIELSPRANRAVLVSGLLLYLAVVGACALTMGRPILPVEQARFEFVLDGQATQTPERSRAFGRVEVLNHNLPSGQRE